ncbi:hypothetical protein JCM8097_006817 [Rhodosporidiobolus ruineniae]
MLPSASDGPQRSLIFLRTPSAALDVCPYTAAALSAGFSSSSIHHLPVLSTSLTNLDRLARVLEEGLEGAYDGVVMTSARSAEAWAAAAASLDSTGSSPSSRDRTPFFVVGQGTRTALLQRTVERHRPREEDILGADESGTGETLARFILAHYGEGGAGATTKRGGGTGGERGERARRLLYLTGDKNRDTLPSILSSSPSPSISLDPLQAYATSTIPSFHASLASHLSALSSPSPTVSSTPPPPSPAQEVWLALFSPSSAAPLFASLRALSLLPPSSIAAISGLRLRFVAIGPTTRDYVEQKEGVTVDATAERPEAVSLVKAVVRAIREEEEGAGGKL